GQPVPFISSRLDDQPEREPARLKRNEGKAFIGDFVRGIGFVLEPDEAKTLLARNPRNRDCLFPYLNGEDLNSHSEQQPSRWVICFHDWPLERAREYPELLKIVEERVKPERDRLTGPGDKRNREFWWQFGAYRAGLRQAIDVLRRVLIRSRVSELHSLTFVPKGLVYSEQTIVFAFDDDYHFALLQSAVHETWLRKQASSLRTDIRYTPTDCFDTFPFPPAEYAAPNLQELLAQPVFARAAQLGAEYHEHRRQVMLARGLGLTKTYNLFHNPACQDADIVRLRELHAEMDNAVLACYGWEDLELRHDFYQNDRGQTRFMPSAEARRELIFRLMALNEKMAEEEKS
ncbi:MAG: restriction endonuclease, partial [candidate division KSB1 bacterium]|nr:restriction endonuclease [candidate division KSB1 bacterium]